MAVNPRYQLPEWSDPRQPGPSMGDPVPDPGPEPDAAGSPTTVQAGAPGDRRLAEAGGGGVPDAPPTRPGGWADQFRQVAGSMTLQGGGVDPMSYMAKVIHLERSLNETRLQQDPSVVNVTKAHAAFNRIDDLQRAIDDEIQQSSDYDRIAREALRSLGPPPLEGQFLPEELRTAMAKAINEQIAVPRWRQAGPEDLNHGEVAASLGFGIGRLLRGDSLASVVPGLTVPIELAQGRVDRQYQSDLQGAQIRRQDRDFRVRSLQEQIQTGLQRFQTAKGAYDREAGNRMEMASRGHLDAAKIYQARIGQLTQEQQRAWDAYLKQPSESAAARLRTLDPDYAPTPDQVTKDSQQLRSKNLIAANHDWRETLRPYLNEFGEVDPVNRASLEQKRAAFAAATGVSVDELDPIPTGETLRKQSQAQRVQEFKQKLQLDKDRLSAQNHHWSEDLAIKRANVDVAKKRLEVAWQNAVTARTQAQTGQAQLAIQRYRAELAQFEASQKAFNSSAWSKLKDQKSGLERQAAEARAFANSLAGQKFADPQKVAQAKAKADGLEASVRFLTDQLEPDNKLPDPLSLLTGDPATLMTAPNPAYVAPTGVQPVVPPIPPALQGQIPPAPNVPAPGAGPLPAPAGGPVDMGFDGPTKKIGGWTIGRAKQPKRGGKKR